MNVLTKTNDYDSFTNSTKTTDDENDEIKIILKYLFHQSLAAY